MNQKFPFHSYLLLWLIPLVSLWSTHIIAQQACPNSGVSIAQQNTNGFLAYAIGDITVMPTGINPQSGNANWLLTPTAQVTVYSALIIDSAAILRLKSGAQLSVYGDFINKGHLILEPGAVIKFYGKKWQNHPNATVQDGYFATDTLSGGSIEYTAPRPLIPASVNATSCVLTYYNGGHYHQIINGGDVPMDVTLKVLNDSNVVLQETPLHIAGKLSFAIEDGDIMLQNQNLRFAPSAYYYWNIADRSKAYIITNDTTLPNTCGGSVEKMGMDTNNFFIYPIGRREYDDLGDRDFSPILVQIRDTPAQSVKVDVRYNQEVATIGVPHLPTPQAARHIFRVQTQTGAPLGMVLPKYLTPPVADVINYFDIAALANPLIQINATQNIEGQIRKGLGSGNGGIRRRGVYAVARSGNNCQDDSASWYFKIADSALYLFNISREGCIINISTKTNLSLPAGVKIAVMRSNSADSTNYIKLGDLKATSNGSYTFKDLQPAQNATNHYYLVFYGEGFEDLLTDTKSLYMDCSEVQLYPSPTERISYLTGLKPGYRYALFAADGKKLSEHNATGACETIDLAPYAAGIYFITAYNLAERIATLRVVKK